MSERNQEIAIRIEGAHQSGRLSDAALEALKKASLPANLSLGTSMENFDPDEALLVTVMPDDSTSLNCVVKRKSVSPGYTSRPMLEGERRDYGPTELKRFEYDIQYVEADHPEANAEAIRTGHNTVLDALVTSPRPERVLFATRYLNGHLLNPYGPLDQVVRLDRRNFVPSAGTPLLDQAVELLKMVLAKYEQFRADWRSARTATLLVTDGRDEHSRIQTARSVTEVIRSMRNTGHHIIAAMGIDDGRTDFRKVFTDMGIDSKWILTTGSTKEEIQQAFGLFAKAAQQATVIEDFPKMLNSGFEGIIKV